MMMLCVDTSFLYYTCVALNRATPLYGDYTEMFPIVKRPLEPLA